MWMKTCVHKVAVMRLAHDCFPQVDILIFILLNLLFPSVILPFPLILSFVF